MHHEGTRKAKMESKWRLEASLKGQMEFKWRLEAILEGHMESKLHFGALDPRSPVPRVRLGTTTEGMIYANV